MRGLRALRFAWLSILIFALPGLGATPAPPTSGHLVWEGKPVPVSEIAAFRMRDQFNPRTLETHVVLPAKPVDRAKISAPLNPYTPAINDPAVLEADYLAFS